MGENQALMRNMLIYDIETLRPVKPKNDADRIPGIKYAESFEDFEGLGIACLCAYQCDVERYRVFDVHNLSEFKKLLAKYEILVGFNNHKFDDRLFSYVAKAELTSFNPVIRSYDILKGIYTGLGLNPDGPYYDKRYKQNNLENIAMLNLKVGKSLDGQLAPILWQQGQYAKVIDYCLDDVRLTYLLMEMVMKGHNVITHHGPVSLPLPPQRNFIKPNLCNYPVSQDWD